MNADFRIDGKVIETKRLILRSFKQTDLEDFYEYASVEGVGEMAGWKHHENIAESQSIMNSFISEDKVFAICLKKNNKVIGTVGIEKYGLEDALTEFKDYYGRELGYVLSKDYWGKGLMPEAVNAVKDYLFGELDYDFLICGYYDFNESFNRFLIISLDVLICRYSPLLRAFPALFISEEPHKSFYYPSCFHSQK